MGPIPTRGNKIFIYIYICVENYRPISILSSLSKVLEKLINIRLVNFLESANLLSTNQFGFRIKRSTSDAVHSLTDYVATGLDVQKKCIAVFLDLAEAFDTVSIPTLLTKLECLGIRGLPLELFKSYLSERSQRVKIGEWISEPLSITYGIPQGSILGPTLFIIYINDLCQLSIVNGNIITFADDTALIFKANTWAEVFHHAQEGVNNVKKWLCDHLLTLNIEKTKYLAFSIHKPLIPSNLQLLVHSCKFPQKSICSCSPLQRVEVVKYLGVDIDNNLRFKRI